jgi:lysophospholipase
MNVMASARLLERPDNPIPPGAVAAMVAGRGKVPLRVAWWPATETPARGTVLLVQGRAECIEKYFESVAELLRRGFAVVAFDLRGQGGSGRLLPDPSAGHVASFHDYIADIEAVLDGIAEPNLPKPFYGLAHSTGAAALLLGVRRVHPRLARIVATAPLLGLPPTPMPDALAGVVLDVACLIGLKRRKVSPRGPGVAPMGVFEGNPVTSDPARYARNYAILEESPGLRIGPPTLGWIKAARDATITLRKPELIARITTPTLLVACGADRIVPVRAVEWLGRRLPAGGTVLIPGARHEVMMESEPYRSQFWAAFDAFVPGER